MTVRRLFVEKLQGFFDVPARQLAEDLIESFRLVGLRTVRLVRRYDIEGLSDAEYKAVRDVVFAEPPVDVVYEEQLPDFPNTRSFAVEFLPGQYDQRADSAAQCVQLVTQKERPTIRTATVVMLVGDISDAAFNGIKSYLINEVECREASLEKPKTLAMATEEPQDVEVLDDFNYYSESRLASFSVKHGLAMNLDDLVFCQRYFKDIAHRAPTITELRVIDTYWSDHCRHTTFTTAVDHVSFEEGPYRPAIETAYEKYLFDRQMVYGAEPDRDVTLMDIAVMGMKALRKEGKLAALDESEEINACSVVVDADHDGRPEKWLVMFKNETHNHPTEIEPFGGAATCLGGAIRDPLSGRSYVYQAMRLTGAADPRMPVRDTRPGKLPQKKITRDAAAGYSSYGNQIGLATGQVAEVYHPGYMAKRMEIGAVIAAAPQENVVRQSPTPGDVVLLVGGRTGRDGCGGATGSSKEHTIDSLAECGAEVQKGNPPTERKIQRLFRRPEIARLIKRCNDFGAGGVAVAIGELTDGLSVDLDAVPKKYEGLDGTELAISESQERMAVVLAPQDAAAFIRAADEENLEATEVARVTSEPRLVMRWRGKVIVNLERKFLATNGVRQHVEADISQPDAEKPYLHTLPDEIQECGSNLFAAWLKNLSRLNVCSQKGLSARFDSTVGAGTILMPFGGKNQMTPQEGMAAKLPMIEGETTTATVMAYGLDPYFMEWSPFHGAMYAIVEAVAKIVAMGGNVGQLWLTLQEYFESLGKEPKKWGKPFAALLGALWAQRFLGVAAIGGKDSMSGTFMEIHVPPTLAAFAVGVLSAENVVSAEFKAVGSTVYAVPCPRDESDLPDFGQFRYNLEKIAALTSARKVLSAATVRAGGVAAAVTKMCLGNGIGFCFDAAPGADELFLPDYGTILLEIPENTDVDVAEALAHTGAYALGYTMEQPNIVCGGVIFNLAEAENVLRQPLERMFPTKVGGTPVAIPQAPDYTRGGNYSACLRYAKPRVFIPVFPGTNCEYDSARAFERAGAKAETLIIRNLTPQAVAETVDALVKGIRNAQIVMLPGGFSGGDEPDGSGKFIAAMFRNPRIRDGVMELLTNRDGLMLGICNGFQALIKLGLVPYGDIRPLKQNSPTLTFNTIGRHVSCMVRTKVVSNLSPWLAGVPVGSVQTIPVSHGEGRFYADKEILSRLRLRGQIATQYVDAAGNPSMDVAFNPNGSVYAIEGITSPDGRVFGKMGHSERIGENIGVNVPGEKDQQLFASGVEYYS